MFIQLSEHVMLTTFARSNFRARWRVEGRMGILLRRRYGSYTPRTFQPQRKVNRDWSLVCSVSVLTRSTEDNQMMRKQRFSMLLLCVISCFFVAFPIICCQDSLKKSKGIKRLNHIQFTISTQLAFVLCLALCQGHNICSAIKMICLLS